MKATVAASANYKAATSAAAKFTIRPKATTLKSLSAAVGGFTATWYKRTTQTTGYQVQYATDANFTKNVKTVTVSSTATVSKKVTGLKTKTKYYVRVRAYKKVGTTNYYSSWSAAKYVTTKATALRA